ncbi:MAG TPA: DUF5655 domain-containing protein [Flavilitoribacter sp.]|nr:DUF5655 domain-containing protein [Flavilitoribacter sp.]HMQ89587.1 DUF5655 domain-containing protein [Flavilitoribacter sp.]
MTKTSGEIEQEFIEGLKASTGKNLADWLTVIHKSGIEKRNDIINWLKSEQGFGHMNASLLAGIHLNGGKPVYASEANLLDHQFEKCPEMRPLFDHLQAAILNWDPEVTFLAKKTYVSILKKREFAAVNMRKGELRLGLDLGDIPFSDSLEKSKLTGPMARISHMVTIRSEADLNEAVLGLMKTANDRVNI